MSGSARVPSARQPARQGTGSASSSVAQHHALDAFGRTHANVSRSLSSSSRSTSFTTRGRIPGASWEPTRSASRGSWNAHCCTAAARRSDDSTCAPGQGQSARERERGGGGR